MLTSTKLLALSVLFTHRFVTAAANESPGCPDIRFIGCLFRLRSQRVLFEKNMMNVVFGVKSEARLIHTCKAYSETMPCFRDKIVECGNQKQRELLQQVSRLLMFMCSPFSLPRQKSLIQHQQCIGNILKLPATTGCTPDPLYQQQLQTCRTHCSTKPSDFICIMKTWVTEQNLCTLKDIDKKCGSDASKFYTELQVTVFEPNFPVLCESPKIDLISEQSTTMSPHPLSVAAGNATRPQFTFSRRMTGEARAEAKNTSMVPIVSWDGMPVVTPPKTVNELIPLKEHFPAQKLAFASFLNNVFPVNVTERFIAYNYSSVLPTSRIRAKPAAGPVSLPLLHTAPLAPATFPRHGVPIIRFVPARASTPAPSIRIFSAKPRFAEPRNYLSLKHRSPALSSITDDAAARRWKPWYLGGDDREEDVGLKRTLALYQHPG
ncbi:hypothetical protein L596_003521 [Steinernema carpocapsae]|uniref:Chondroitin proteoglycan 4 domain-containing protein n=1 Tax=Steinernema carpocapsae TaxID=34508 RepID=A0A4U8USN6_STECR|nr:hypothetical protein L596_003521 [Steinernema carpocapsae]